MMKRELSCFLYVSKSLLKMKATLKRKNLFEIQLGRFSSNQFIFFSYLASWKSLLDKFIVEAQL